VCGRSPANESEIFVIEQTVRVFMLALALAAGAFAQPNPAPAAAPRKTVTFFALDAPEAPAAIKAEPRALPQRGTVLLQQGGVQWFGASQGLTRIDQGGGVQYLVGLRYLPDNDVRNVVADTTGGVWVRTATGIAHIDYRPIALADKAAELERIEGQRHFRYGFAEDAELAHPGDLSHSRPLPSDNDGLWTAMYASAECFRYAVDHSPEALSRAQASLDAVLFLTTVSSIPGYPARSYVRAGEPIDGDTDRWFDTTDKRLRWKGDTSSDEIVGHFYLYAVAFDLLPGGEQKQRVVTAVRAITDHILSHGYYLVGEKGKPTTWGRWAPEYFLTSQGRLAAPLNAIELLSLLKVAVHITGDARYEREYQKAARTLGYAQLGTRYLELIDALNYSDEELFMLAIQPLMAYEHDPELLGLYQQALDQWWRNEQREQNPLWSVIYAHSTRGQQPDLVPALGRLASYPLDRVKWSVSNSGRGDVPLLKAPERDGCRESSTLLPLDELPVERWNTNPFCVDGGEGGREEAENTSFLLPYWMARYYRISKLR
jgi:hypothetical protein